MLHHTYLIPNERVFMMNSDHSMVWNIKNEWFGMDRFIKPSVGSFPHPLESVISFTFAYARTPVQLRITEPCRCPELCHQVYFRSGNVHGYVYNPDDILTDVGDYDLIWDWKSICSHQSNSKKYSHTVRCQVLENVSFDPQEWISYEDQACKRFVHGNIR